MKSELMVCATSDSDEALLCRAEDVADLNPMTECWLWNGEELSTIPKPAAVWTKFVIMENSIDPPLPASEVLGVVINDPT